MNIKRLEGIFDERDAARRPQKLLVLLFPEHRQRSVHLDAWIIDQAPSPIREL
jgi:hypothetical protein